MDYGTHASALIAAGVDIVTGSRRLGHDSSITLGVYTHAFAPDLDTAAARASVPFWVPRCRNEKPGAIWVPMRYSVRLPFPEKLC